MAINPDEYTGISSPADSSGHRIVNSLIETAEWEDEIYQIEKNDMLAGGEKGLANLQAQQLANRTSNLRERLELTDQKIRDSIRKSARIKNIENMVMELYMAKEAESKSPTGYSGIMVEMFKGDVEEIDKTEVAVDFVASDGSSVNVSDSSGIAIGNCYQYVDKDHTEEVRIKSVDILAKGCRVTFETPLASHSENKGAKLCRTSSIISNGHANGGGIASAIAENTSAGFSGSTTQKSVNFAEYGQFSIKGAKIENGKLTVDWTVAYGVALYAAGNNDAGFWKRINVNGNDLTQGDIS